MIQPIDFADYDAGWAAVPKRRADDAQRELETITPYSDTLGTLRRFGEEGVMIAVASNLALPYTTPLRALFGILMAV